MSSNKQDLPLITEEEIALLLQHEELTPELQDLIQQYQQATTIQVSEAPLTKEEEHLYPIGTQCAIIFAFEKYQLLLLPAIILNYSSPDQAQVLILTPVTKDTIPCAEYFSDNKQCSSCSYSHGYPVSIDHMLPIEALELDSISDQLQYGKKVWCKKEGEDLWRLGDIIDQLHGPRWRVRLKGGRKRNILNVDLEHIVPFKSLDDNESNEEEEEWSESDRESVDDTVEAHDQNWGSWQAHTTGFAAKMMKKMGYVDGKGLGMKGEGRIDPIEVKPYSNQQNRPGLGLKNKKKKPAVNKNTPTQDIFNLVNTLLDTKKVDSSVPIKTATRQQTNQTMAKLQSLLDKTQQEYLNATDAFRRNKGSPMENQFSTKLKNVTSRLQDLKRQMYQLEGHVKREKERQNMYTF